MANDLNHARALMVQGTGSDAGKSLLVAGLARAFTKRGLSVAPFKPQNMSNNAAVTVDGGEIGRAQALQARACGLVAHTDMNPVLLKPEGDTGAQLVVGGRVRGRVGPQDYRTFRDQLLPDVLAAFTRLKSHHDLVLVEGAGSPSEVNLRAGDIANMGFAQAADVPVILAGDVEKGGVIAQIVGTHAVLMPSERQRIQGFVINKFRGDTNLFDAAMTEMEARTGWAGLGVVPWFADAQKLPKEDSASLGRWAETGRGAGDTRIKVAVLKTERLANFDDLDPLMAEGDVQVLLIEPGQALPGDVDIVVIAGSKAVISDLRFLKDQDWDVDILAHVNRGGLVVGLCGGYQMLGLRICDPDGVEGDAGEEMGLGLLDVETVLTADKTLEHVRGTEAVTGISIQGYEMHLGLTEGPDRHRPWLHLSDGGSGTREDGAVSASGRVMGTYVHGVFASDAFRHDFLSRLRENRPVSAAYEDGVDAALNGLAEHLEKHLDLDAILALAQ